MLAESSPIPTTSTCCIATVDDFEKVREVGERKVHITIGSALDIFGGELSFDSVVELCA